MLLKIELSILIEEVPSIGATLFMIAQRALGGALFLKIGIAFF